MDREWMREQLEKFGRLCEDYGRLPVTSYGNRHREISTEMATLDPTIRQILKRLDPKLAEIELEPQYTGGVHDAIRAVQKGLGILRDQDEWEARLAPDAPSLVADKFHPRIWGAASVLWDTGQYRVAVGQAAIALSAHIAAKSGSHLADRKLVKEVFASAEPPAGKTRLHMPGNKATETWKSCQEGLHLMAQGAFAGIRNIAAHDEDEWPEHVALEHLAVLSVVARWADEAEVVRGPDGAGPPPAR
ncbi:MAG TPA: TIGR02391 family protein [Streptosporangiaceae bacterium]|nr:TIGR02391 family protein [Streptosporangiaceae bacterium]